MRRKRARELPPQRSAIARHLSPCTAVGNFEVALEAVRAHDGLNGGVQGALNRRGEQLTLGLQPDQEGAQQAILAPQPAHSA